MKRRTKGEGSIHYDAQRARWIGRIWIDRKSHTVSARTKGECAQKLGRLIHVGPARPARSKGVTVGQILADWQNMALPNRNLAPSTRDSYEWAIRQLVNELGKKQVDDLRVEDIERALRRLAHRSSLGRSSLIKVRSVLSQVMAWALRRGIVARNPTDGAELPTDLAPKQTKRALSVDELSSLFDALAEHPRRAMLVTMGTVGLRPGEAAALCADVVDLDAGTITVRRAVRLEKNTPVVTSALKTAGSYRTLELPAIAVEALRAHITATGAAGNDLLFPGRHGGPLYPSAVRKDLAKTCERAGLGRLSPNELRHSAATLLSDYLPQHQVADMLGHTNTRMLDEVYRKRPAVIRGGAVIEQVFAPKRLDKR